MTHLYAVVGEHCSRPDRLLVLGADGQHYAWELDTDETTPVEPDDEWTIDRDIPSPKVLFGEPTPGVLVGSRPK